MLAPRDKLTICFAHAAYRMAEQFAGAIRISPISKYTLSTRSRHAFQRRTWWLSP